MSVNDIFGFEWCKNAFLYWPGHTDQTHSGLFTFVLGGLQFLGLVMILIYLWRQARNEAAQRKWNGDKQSPAPQSLEDPNIAANTLIFPLYVRLLWLCAASALWCGLVSILLPYNINTPNTLFLSIMYGSAWGVQHLLFEGIACLLMSYGVGSRATHRTMLISTLWAATTMGVEFLVYYDSGSELAIWISTGWASLLFLFYSALWLAPASWIYRRPAVHSYAAFWAVTRAMLIASNLMRHFDIDFGYCVYGASSAGLLSVVVPYVIYAALLRDSRYWQGILTLKSDDLYSSNSISIRNPLLGTSLDPSSARAIAQRMDHRLHGVPILNFANLKIDQLADEYTSNRDRHVVLGAGSTSRVFRGTWQGKPVAIKMIFCVDLTPEIITKFYHEATLLSDLVHPNVVSIIGVCVLPPSICLVMELCPGGNLYDYLRSAPRLALEDQLRLACDCSRAVSYLHSHVPAILHLDLKSMNFLLGVDGSIKVADLELSREVVVQDADDDGITSIPDGDGAQTVVQHVATGSALSGYHIPDTVNWIAPEIMLGLPYNEKADVYSLAMVVWEILTGQVPFYDLQQILAKQPKPSSQPSSTRSVTRSLSSNSPRDSPRDMRSPSILSHDMPRPSPRTAITAASTDMPRPSPRTAITAASTTGFNRYAIQTTNYNLAPPHHHEHVSTTASVNSPSTVASSLSSLCSSQSDSSSLTTSPDQTSQSSYSPPAMESTLSTIRYSSSDGNLPNLPIPQHIVTSMTSASFLYNSGTPGISPSPSQSLTSTPDESQPNTQPNTQPTSPTSTSPHHLTIHVTSDAPSMPVSHSVYTTPFGSPGGFLSDDTSWGRATKGTLAIPPQRPRSSSEIYHPTSTPSRAALYRPETRDELIRRLQALQSPTTTTPACIRDRIPRMARFHIPTPSPQPTTTTTDPSPRHSRKRKSKSHKSSRSRGITSHASPRLMLTRSRDEINDELKRMICEQGVRPLIPPSCPAALASLLQRAWATDPDHRPTAAEMYQALLVIRLEVINQSNAYDQIQRGQPTLPSVHTKSVTEAIQANVALAHDERSICTPPQSAPVTIISSPSSIIHPQPSPSP